MPFPDILFQSQPLLFNPFSYFSCMLFPPVSYVSGFFFDFNKIFNFLLECLCLSGDWEEDKSELIHQALYTNAFPLNT